MTEEQAKARAIAALEWVAKSAEALMRYAREASGLSVNNRLDHMDVANVLDAYERISNNDARQRLGELCVCCEAVIACRTRRQEAALRQALEITGIDVEVALGALKGKEIER